MSYRQIMAIGLLGFTVGFAAASGLWFMKVQVGLTRKSNRAFKLGYN